MKNLLIFWPCFAVLGDF